MGEYANRKSDGVNVKIGTCDSMYYLRYEDRNKVDYPHSFIGSRFRLPFPDEDDVQIGDYEQYNRGIGLYKVTYRPDPHYADCVKGEYEYFEFDNITESDAGTVQLHHENGYLLNVKCYHGQKLPEGGEGVRVAWNGKASINYELKSIKLTEDGMKAIVGCRWCGEKWRLDIGEILEYIPDEKLRERIRLYEPGL